LKETSTMPQAPSSVDFALDRQNLYREENYTDLNVGAIRRLIPVHPDGTPDAARTEVFVGTAHLMTPGGPLPVQAVLPANNFAEALNSFPAAMQGAMAETLEELQEMQREQKRQDASRIIVPGR
jgi:hypothetical protein